MSDAIASEFSGDQPARFTPVTFEQPAEKPFSCALISTALHQDVHDITVLIHGTPELMPLALTGNKDFINVPRLARYESNKCCGELAAVHEFNANNDMQKIDEDCTLFDRPIPNPKWHKKIFAIHFLDHPSRQETPQMP